jgi:hypothetical protein
MFEPTNRAMWSQKLTNPNDLKNAQTHKIKRCEAKCQKTYMICKVCKRTKLNNVKPKVNKPKNLQSVQTHKIEQHEAKIDEPR